MKIKQLLIAVCIGMMFSACSSEDTPTQNAGGIPINFTANIQNLIPSVGTRVADGTSGMVTTSFPENSEIRVGFNDGYDTSDSYITNSSTNWAYKSTSPKLYLPYNSTSKIIVALYPAPSYSMFDMSNCRQSWVVSSDQSSIDSYKNSDMLGAVTTVTKENAEAVALNFKHIGAKVLVNVKNGSSNVSGYKITMTNIYTNSPLSLHGGAFKFNYEPYAHNNGSVIFGESSSTGGQAAIIIPQTIASDVTLFEVTKNDVTYTFTTSESITLKSGYSYTFDLKFENTEIGFGSVTISNDWGTDPDKSTFGGTLSEQTT